MECRAVEGVAGQTADQGVLHNMADSHCKAKAPPRPPPSAPVPPPSPTDYQLHLSTSDGMACRSVVANGMALITCSEVEPDSWTTFKLSPHRGDLGFDALTTGNVFNLNWRPAGGVPLGRIAPTPTGFGVVVQSSNSMINPFKPMERPRPPGSVLMAGFVFEVSPGVAGESIGWDMTGSHDLLLKAVDYRWSTTVVGDAYCTVRDVDAVEYRWSATVFGDAYCTVRDVDDEYSDAVGKHTQILVCDPDLDPADAVRFKITTAGATESTSLVLLSHKTERLCGFDDDGNITCNGLAKLCCASQGLDTMQASVWWNYVTAPGSSLPLNEDTSFMVQAWDDRTNSPIAYWEADPETSTIFAATANPGVPLTNPSTFRLLQVTPGSAIPALVVPGVTTPVQVVPGFTISVLKPLTKGGPVLILSETLERFCRPSETGTWMTCDGTPESVKSDLATSSQFPVELHISESSAESRTGRSSCILHTSLVKHLQHLWPLVEESRCSSVLVKNPSRSRSSSLFTDPGLSVLKLQKSASEGGQGCEQLFPAYS
eukprot:gene24291-9892_t